MKQDVKWLEGGWQLVIQETATSTSDVLFAQQTLTEGMAVLARQQTAGRGRQGRLWQSKLDDGMYLSLALFPKRAMRDWPSLSFVTALALLGALQQLIPDIKVGLKWPNDLLVNDKKICGILLEAKQDMLVLGCGVNLKNAPDIAGARFPATDLLKETGQRLAPQKLAEAFLGIFQTYYHDWQATGFSAHYDLYKSHLLFVSQHISITQGEHVVTGIMRGISKTGDLLIEDDKATVISLSTGDVNLIGKIDATRD